VCCLPTFSDESINPGLVLVIINLKESLDLKDPDADVRKGSVSANAIKKTTPSVWPPHNLYTVPL
jgi:hypothetical protein